MIARTLKGEIQRLSQRYPVVTVTGPRQSGKSTLLKNTFPDYVYVSLEDLDVRELAATDPRGFLDTYSERIIIDEVQRVPSLFSYLQTHVDKVGESGMFILAGSHNFQLMEGVNQSLAGRTAILRLLPFSHQEMREGGILTKDINEEIFNGGYPRIYDKSIAPTDYYPFYIQTYVERDVRQMKNIGDLSRFVRFVRLCAGRIGQLLNISSLANECGISVATASAWLSILEASYICYLLRPDWNNYAKRIVKTPKLYFYDTGLACSLLDIRTSNQIATHFLRGGLYENMVINEFLKRAWHNGKIADLRFWRDSQGNEVDLLDYDGDEVMAYEIKSGATFSTDYFKGIARWAALTGVSESRLNVIYGGETSLNTSKGKLIAWQDLFG